MTKYPCRCRKCGSRKTLAKHPDNYIIDKYRKCGCGGEFRVDWYRKRTEHKKNKCYCDGYWFPHRKGGGVWCKHHPVGPSEQDLELRYGPYEPEAPF